MFKLAALALIGSAAAFAPAQQGASSSALNSAFENEVSLPRLRLLLVEIQRGNKEENSFVFFRSARIG